MGRKLGDTNRTPREKTKDAKISELKEQLKEAGKRLKEERKKS